MSISFNSNINSLRAQNSLSVVTERLSTHYSRLSSGMRINRASDDAAGLAIADSLRADTRLYTTAIRNAADGISALNVVDGALSEQKSILIRLQELAEQSANGTYTNTQRAALNLEYQALLKEFGRIGDTTVFNGQNLMLGQHGLENLSLQVGINGDSLSRLTVETSNTGNLSGIINFDDLPTTAEAYAGFIESSFEEISDVFNGLVSHMSVVDDSGQKRDLVVGFSPSGVDAVRIFIYQKVSDTGGVGSSTNTSTVTDESYEYIPAHIQAHLWLGNDGEHFESASFDLIFNDGANSATFEPDIKHLVFSNNPINAENTPTSAIDFTGVETSGRALVAMDVLGNRMTELSSISSKVGAAQSRLQSITSVLFASRENTAAAESKIRDADIAQETAGLVSAQILQQSAVAVLAQANKQPALLLSLLD